MVFPLLSFSANTLKPHFFTLKLSTLNEIKLLLRLNFRTKMRLLEKCFEGGGDVPIKIPFLHFFKACFTPVNEVEL